MTFEEAWALKVAEGYQYGPDALEQVRLGWEMALGCQHAGHRDAPRRASLHAEPPVPVALDTLNEWMITAKEDVVLVQRHVARLLQPEEALRLAAWLIVGAEMAGYQHSLEVAQATVQAVRSA